MDCIFQFVIFSKIVKITKFQYVDLSTDSENNESSKECCISNVCRLSHRIPSWPYLLAEAELPQ